MSGGPIENSPRRVPWGRGHPPHAQPRQGRQRLLPDIPLVVRDPMRLQEGEEFLLQGNRAVVLLLVANILHHRGYVGLADAEGAVPRLPSEGRPMPPNSSSPHGSRVGYSLSALRAERSSTRTVKCRNSRARLQSCRERPSLLSALAAVSLRIKA